jgi:hypothetical protein
MDLFDCVLIHLKMRMRDLYPTSQEWWLKMKWFSLQEEKTKWERISQEPFSCASHIY